LSFVAALGLAAGSLLAVTAGPAAAGGSGTITLPGTVGPGTISASPYQNVSAPQSIAVTGSGLPASTTLAVTMCANAHSDGTTPVTPAELASQQYCFAAQGDVGTHIFLASTDSSGNLSQAYSLATSGIGAAGGTCVARQPGWLPCSIAVADAGTQGTVFTGTLPIYMSGSVAPPTLQTTAVTNQTNTAAGRAGSAITLGGTNWQNANSGFTVALCATASGTGCDPAFVTQTASVTGNDLTGSATIPASPTHGARYLVVSNSNGDTAAEQFTVLDTPTVSLSPNTGGPGTLVQVSGTNWDTGANVNAFTTDGTNPLGPSSAGTVGANGSFSGVIVTVSSSSTVGIGVVQGASLASPDLFPGTANPIAGGAQFLFSATSCVPSGQHVVGGSPTTGGPDANTATGSATDNGCSLLQTVNLTVNGSTLQFSEAGSNVTLTAKTLNGADQTTDGAIQELTVNDSRGSLAGWVVVATMNNLTDGTNGATPANHHAIPAANVSTNNVACSPLSSSTGVASDVAAGLGGSFDPTAPITLCTAVTGGGGGTFTIDSGLSMLVPASIAAGHYTATMTFLVT
jgi:hypothetical protein